MSDSDSKIILAKWSDRFFAWLIDFIIISAICALILITFIAINSLKIPSPSKLNKYTIPTEEFL